MKKIIIILVFITILGLGYFYFFNKTNVAIQQEEGIDTIPIKEVKQTKEVRVGDMVIDVPKEVEIVKDAENYYSILIQGKYKEYQETKEGIKNQAVRISYGKNWNEENLSLQDWFDLNGPQTQKTSATSLYDEFKKIKNITYLESLYQAPTSMYKSNYYDVSINYFNHKTDIYEVTNYKKSETQYPKLTKEEQESIDNYEKIVDEIIQSIRFVE